MKRGHNSDNHGTSTKRLFPPISDRVSHPPNTRLFVKSGRYAGNIVTVTRNRGFAYRCRLEDGSEANIGSWELTSRLPEEKNEQPTV